MLIGVAVTAASTALITVVIVLTDPYNVGKALTWLSGSTYGRTLEQVVPVAALLGALLVTVADTLGRTVIAPGQLPAGLLTALLGTPWFVWLLWRSRGN